MSLTGELELVRLIDLCAEQLDLNIEYDAAVLKGMVTLRLGGGVSDAELWSLTNRVLASRGFATVQRPGEGLFSIVKLNEAPKHTRVRLPPSEITAPGADPTGPLPGTKLQVRCLLTGLIEL